MFRKLWIPLRKKYDFRTDNLTNGITKNIAIVAIAYHDGNPANGLALILTLTLTLTLTLDLALTLTPTARLQGPGASL